MRVRQVGGVVVLVVVLLTGLWPAAQAAPLKPESAEPVRPSGPPLSDPVYVEAAAPAAQEQTPVRKLPLEQGTRLRVLNEQAGIPMAELLRLSDAEIWTALKEHAGKLGAAVYELNAAGEMELVVDGRPASPDLPAPTPGGRVDGLPRLNYRPLASPPTPAQLVTRLNQVKSHWWNMFAAGNGLGYMHEFNAAFPLNVRNRSPYADYTWPRQLGEYWQVHAHAMGRINSAFITPDYELYNVGFEQSYNWDFNEPFVWADKVVNNPPWTLFEVTFVAYNNCDPNNDPCNGHPLDMYLGDSLIVQNVQSLQLPIVYQVGFNPGYNSSLRYMGRIGGQMGRRLWSALAYNHDVNVRSLEIGTMLDTYGYVWDQYDPFFNESAYMPDDFNFQTYTYPDCDLYNVGVDSVQPRGASPYRYPYESKVCLNRTAWIAVSRVDFIAPGLQAIHILNKYNNPDYAYPDPRDGMGTVTPREIARWYEAPATSPFTGGGWNGIGIRYWGKNISYASGLRTDIFWLLETLLGYKFNDATAQGYADTVAEQAMKRVWGVDPFPLYTGETVDFGTVARSGYQGAPLLAWKQGNSFDFGYPDSTFIQDVLDILNMPRETFDMGPISVAETVQTYLQTARVYLYYKHGQVYGSYQFYPRADIRLPANPSASTGGVSIGLDSDPGWSAWELLQAVRATGVLSTSVQRRWEGTYYTCTQTLCPSTPTYQDGMWHWDFSLPAGAGVDISLPAYSPAALLRVPGLPVTAAPVTYHLKSSMSTRITFPEFTEPRVAMDVADLKAALPASCGTTMIWKRNTTPPFGWVYYQPGVSYWTLEQNAAYTISVQYDCDFTP